MSESKTVSDLYAFVPNSCKEAMLESVKLLNAALEERFLLRQKLEAAEARIIDLGEAVASYEHLAESDNRKINSLEQIIRDAREQKPVAEVAGAYAGAYEVGNIIFSTDKVSLPLKTKLYAETVPAMPIQDDNNPALFPELVEAVTKAILFQDSGNVEDWEDNKDIGEAALKAISGKWKVVPTHITPEMRINAWEAAHKLSPNIKNTLDVLWEQLLEASPQSEVKPSC